MIKFKGLIREATYSDDLNELIKNLQNLGVLGRALEKISAKINLQDYEEFGDIEIKVIEKIKEITNAIEKTIQENNKLIKLKEGENDGEEIGEKRKEDIDGTGDIEFKSPERKLPDNF